MIWTYDLDPVALDLGFAQIRWYGVFYAVAFMLGFFWLKAWSRRKLVNFSTQQIEDLIFAVILGVILGGRLGHFLFYDPSSLFSLEIFKIWHGGMSFHGGLIGVLLAVGWLAHKWRRNFLELTDVIVIPASVGLFFGRLGNFINGELIGRATDGAWGVIYPNFDEIPRYPSQLFEAGKNLLIAGILYVAFRIRARRGTISFLFILLYGLGRTLVELLWREPIDGFILGIPKGAVYSIPVFLAGVIGVLWISRKGKNS
ncbi:MAG: prolipoprotein diacylglyceryl transferase [Candidatus Peribacteraceae bacterium]|nr:prolipoprotein diacylglyceryl transferase [Candidatus Peribacteraceae bacterium]